MTAIVPTSCMRDRDAADVDRPRRERALRTARTSPDQIQRREAVEHEEQADRDDHDAHQGAALDGRITAWWIADAADERDRERDGERGPVRPAVVRGQRPGDVGREHRHLALREVDDAGRAVDQHERERERTRRSPPEARPATTCWKKSAISTRGSSGGRPRRRAARRSPRTRRPCRPRARTRCAAASSAIARVLLDDEHGQPLLLVQLAHDPEDLADDHRREAERRLVEQQQPRARHQRAGEREHLLLAAGERARPAGRARVRDPREVPRHPLDVRRDRRAPGGCRRRAAGSPRPTARRRCRGPRARARCRAARPPPGPPRERLARRRGSRPLRWTVPEIARSVVVLPAPFAPSTATIAPSGDLERDAVQRLHRAVAGLDVAGARAARSPAVASSSLPR